MPGKRCAVLKFPCWAAARRLRSGQRKKKVLYTTLSATPISARERESTVIPVLSRIQIISNASPCSARHPSLCAGKWAGSRTCSTVMTGQPVLYLTSWTGKARSSRTARASLQSTTWPTREPSPEWTGSCVPNAPMKNASGTDA